MVERDGRLVTRVDLPGVNKEDVSVLVTDDHFAISGERRRDSEEKKDCGSRSDSEHGTFYRAVPLPEGAKQEDVKVTFSSGVLEVSVLLPARSEANVRKVELKAGKKAASCAA
jgi:HSP20 family protein